MSDDDIDRTDELLELIAEDQRREKASSNGQHPNDSGPPEPKEPPLYASRIYTRSKLRKLPDPAPLIGNVLDQGTCTLLYGHRGTLKTFIAIDWAASVATGRRWQGRDTTQCRALYVAGEGAFGFKNRIDAWESGWKTSIIDGQLDFLPFPVNLGNSVQVNNLRSLIDWRGYGFVILDTLARCMVGLDENSAKDSGIVIDNLYKLLDSTPDRRGVITGVHHTGKDGHTLRGSSAFEGGVDTVYSVTRDGKSPTVILNREKRKDGPELDEHELKFSPVEGSHSGVIAVSTGETDSGRSDRLLSQFRLTFKGIGAYTTQLLEVSGMPKSTFYRALSDLQKQGRLVNNGTAKRPFWEEPGD
ncbi:AAA family ATPase [Mycobacterium sp. OTB74]|uniref:AAA family ATPase n=1 Tax=Mycobacterium sp. OTB74 TaxID=1853452 RepID=UPI0024754C45|nr:AAA family ATPase [Mycobacterium sp. OTB74]MDH6247546.1 hypothetical protein [Mycobacterium sp. OTB74]